MRCYEGTKSLLVICLLWRQLPQSMTFHDLSDIGVEGEEREKTNNKQQTKESSWSNKKERKEKKSHINSNQLSFKVQNRGNKE